MPHDPENWHKIWRKTDLLFQKWQEFGEFWHEYSKVSKICSFIGSYSGKYLIVDLKKVQRSYLSWHAKFEEKLTCGLENDLRNVATFHQSTWKSQNCDFDEIF